MNIIEIAVSDLKPYPKNTKKHDETQIANVAQSIKDNGFVQPLVIDKNNVVVIGHCRLLSAKKLGMETVPCVRVDELTEEQVKALRIVDNKTNESPWELDFLADELAEIDLGEFDFDFGVDMISGDMPSRLFGGEDDEMTAEEKEFKERMARGEISEEDEEYQEFLQKFELKKTTDDCYTPDNIYKAVKDWCVKEYGLKGRKAIRPFYPGGDYLKEEYPEGCVVIDNPPFSIISEICKYYSENGIKYFMFAPTLTLLGINRGCENYVVCGAPVTYENGAVVNTSFVTNMGEYKAVANSELRNAIEKIDEINRKAMHKQLPKYAYPDEVLTATMLSYMAGHNTDLKIKAEDMAFIRNLDAQKESGKGLFGSGFLLSRAAAKTKAAAEKAAAEKANATVWELSEREIEIINSLGEQKEGE